MKNSCEDQAELRVIISTFLIDNPMSWQKFAKGCGISPTTLRKFSRGIDLVRVESLFKILKFMKEYEK